MRKGGFRFKFFRERSFFVFCSVFRGGWWCILGGGKRKKKMCKVSGGCIVCVEKCLWKGICWKWFVIVVV